MVASKILGLAFLLLSAVFLFLTTAQLRGRSQEGNWSALLASCLLVVNFPLIAHSFSGMETALYVFALTLLSYILTRLWFSQFIKTKWWCFFGVCSLFLFFVRPEGIVVAGTAAVALAFRHRKFLVKTKIWIICLFGWVLPLGMFLVWKVSKFGSFFPLAYFHKALRSYDSLFLSFPHLFKFFKAYSWLVFLGMICLIYAVFVLKEKIYVFFALLLVLMVTIYLPFMPVMNYLHRFYIPYLVLLLLLLSPGLHFLYRLSGRFINENLQTLFISSVFFLILFGMNSGLPKDLSTVKFWGKMVDPSQYRAKLGKVMGLLPPDVVVANTEMGVIPYFSGLTCLDMAGLTDPVIARKGLTMEYLEERGTDVILFPLDVSTLDENWFHESGRSYENVFLTPTFEKKFEFIGSFIAWPDKQGQYFFYINRESGFYSEISDWALTYLLRGVDKEI